MKPLGTAGSCLLLFLFISHQSWSQSTVNEGVSIGAANKGFFRYGKRALGGSVEYVGRLWKQGGIKAYAGYDWFDYRLPKNIDPQVLRDSMLKYPHVFSDRSILPLRFGYQQFFFNDAAFVYGEAGVARWMISYVSNKRHVFSYALGTGYRFNLKEWQYVQLSFFYNQNVRYGYAANRRKVSMNSNYFNFRAAYGLNFRKKVK